MLIDKRTAYKALKHEQESHFQSLVSEAYGRAARIVDQMHGADAAAIMKLCNEIEDICIESYARCQMNQCDCKAVMDKIKEIGKELTRDAAD